MESGEKKLNLNTNNLRVDFENIFLPDGKQEFIQQHPFSNYLSQAVGVLAIDFLLLYFTSYYKSIWILLLLTLILSLYLWKKFIKLMRERLLALKQISEYLENVSQYKNAWIILTSDTFQMTIDGIEHIENWSNIQIVEMKENYLVIQGNESFMIPYTSIDPIDLSTLKNAIRKKMYQEEENEDQFKAKI